MDLDDICNHLHVQRVRKECVELMMRPVRRNQDAKARHAQIAGLALPMEFQPRTQRKGVPKRILITCDRSFSVFGFLPNRKGGCR